MASPTTNLPYEIWLNIFEVAPKATLARIAAASREFHDLATPQLYRNVELGALEVHPSNRQLKKERAIRRRQHLFLLTLLIDNSTLGKHIHTFMWVEHGLLRHFVPRHFYFKVSNSTRKLRKQQTKSLNESCFDRLLTLLVNVRYVHIKNLVAFGALNQCGFGLSPAILAPNATKIRLEGYISPRLARDILKDKDSKIVDDANKARSIELESQVEGYDLMLPFWEDQGTFETDFRADY